MAGFVLTVAVHRNESVEAQLSCDVEPDSQGASIAAVVVKAYDGDVVALRKHSGCSVI